MAIPYNNPIDLLGGFKRLYNGPIDDDYVVGIQSDLLIIESPYGGLTSYVESMDSFYYYDGSVWKELGGGSGNVAGVTDSIQVKGIDGSHAGYDDFLWSDANKKLQLASVTLKPVAERIELYDDTNTHYMDIVGSWYKGIDPIDPERFDISVKATVPSGKSTFTLQDQYSSALMFISANKKFQDFNTLTDHIEFSQGLKLFGNIPSGDATMHTLVLDPSNLEVKQIPVPATEPTMDINFATCGGVVSGTSEVGVIYNTTLTKAYNPGTIYSADGSPNIDLTGAATTYLFSGTGADGVTGVVSTSIVLGTNFWALAQDYDAGTGLYYDSFSVSSTLFDAFRVASTANDNSNIITGAYKYWWSVGSIPTTSVGVRALIDYAFYPISTFDIAIPAFETLVAFYLPDTAGTVEVWLVESNANITSTFTQVAMNVDDAGGTPVGYNRYESTIGGIGYSEDVTYRIIII